MQSQTHAEQTGYHQLSKLLRENVQFAIAEFERRLSEYDAMTGKTWEYADYISLNDPSARLERLRLHIQEVAQRTIAIEGRSQNVTAVNQNYLDSLKKEETQLNQQVNGSSFSHFRRNSIEFRRD